MGGSAPIGGRNASDRATLGGVVTPSDSCDPGRAIVPGADAAPLRAAKIRARVAGLRPTSWRDLALCLAACAAWVLEIATSPGQVTPAHLPGGLIATVPFVALAWRPRLGERLLVLAGVCWLAAALMDVSAPDDVVLTIAIYTVATQGPWRRIAESLVPALEGSRSDWIDAVSALATWAILMALLVWLGRWIARRRQFIESLLSRTRNLERERELLAAERDELARRAVAEERARIARELHDVVAHHVSVMVIQAGAAQASLPPGLRAAAANQSIEAIRETGREALAEMRRMLGLLRSQEAAGAGIGGRAGTGSPASGGLIGDRTPQPGLADVAALCERTSEAGVDVVVDVVGAARRLPAGVDLSIYRVVQEALTNSLRHSGPGSKARLRLVYEPASLTVEVTDDGAGRPTVGSVERARTVGHGLLGMRERVLLFGGRLETGPLRGGGFRIVACFPLEPIAEESGQTTPVRPAASVGAQVGRSESVRPDIQSTSSSPSSSSEGAVP